MVSYSRDGCGITCFTMLGRIQMLAHLGRQPGEATVLPHSPYQLQHLLPFLLPTESFSVEWERGMGSPGEQRAGGVLCLLSAAEWSIHNCWHHWLPPPPLHLSAAKGWGKQGPLSGHPALGLHSSVTQKTSEINPEGCFLSFPGLWPQIMSASDMQHPQPWSHGLTQASHATFQAMLWPPARTALHKPVTLLQIRCPLWKWSICGTVTEWNLLELEEGGGEGKDCWAHMSPLRKLLCQDAAATCIVWARNY